MSNPTTPFSWQMPTSTDLVTDLPADFEVFGQAVASSMADLLGGTSGQILSKASNTDMDFTWIANDQGDITAVNVTSPITGGGTAGAVTVGIQDALTTQKGAVQLSDSTSTTSSVLAATPTAVKASYDLAAAAIPKSTVTTNGDIIYGTGSGTVTRLGVGSAGQVLTVASGIPSWATASAGQLVLLNTTTFSSVSSQSVDNVFSSTYDNYVLYFYQTAASANHNLRLDMRVSSTDTGMTSQMVAQYSTTITGSDNGSGSATRGLLCTVGSSYAGYTAGKVDIMNPNLAQRTTAMGNCFAVNSSGQPYQYRSAIYTDATTSFTGFTLNASSGTISGTLKVYGVKN